MSRAPTVDKTHTLLAMLTYQRPAGSKSEKAFIQEYLLPLGVEVDGYGNLYKRIGTAPVLWSSHTDTVHHRGGRQNVSMIEGRATSDGSCLGADCTAGVFLMAEMIRAGVEGLYIFHRAEEIGGLGSEYIATETPGLLAGIDFAIAFDRRDNTSIITHQWGGRCCSDTFARSLSDALGMDHKSDDGGSFTDTANYTGLVGECTNLSVGYLREHTSRESLDVDYLMELRGALIHMNLSELVYERLPGAEEDWDFSDDADQEPRGPTYAATMVDLVRDNPREVADFLEEYGINAWDLEEVILNRGGTVRLH